MATGSRGGGGGGGGRGGSGGGGGGGSSSASATLADATAPLPRIDYATYEPASLSAEYTQYEVGPGGALRTLPPTPTPPPASLVRILGPAMAAAFTHPAAAPPRPPLVGAGGGAAAAVAEAETELLDLRAAAARAAAKETAAAASVAVATERRLLLEAIFWETEEDAAGLGVSPPLVAALSRRAAATAGVTAVRAAYVDAKAGLSHLYAAEVATRSILENLEAAAGAAPSTLDDGSGGDEEPGVAVDSGDGAGADALPFGGAAILGTVGGGGGGPTGVAAVPTMLGPLYNAIAGVYRRLTASYDWQGRLVGAVRADAVAAAEELEAAEAALQTVRERLLKQLVL
ncbi:hypothetical protein I4F81_000307 [Pyropia yezoensis]|uniref:Uncharacterized protein n=1 Tax=Pyropia yezoensis TaxID=2788 RepID=A0ACC3BIS7_PYRYE|nr:hypothetical protein I4F81_000307 [Neopyropia yezoensis]